MTNHFKEAERLIRRAEQSFATLDDSGFLEGSHDLTRTHYYMQFANTHTLLAQVQAQHVGFDSVGRMADAVTTGNKENN